MNRVEQMNDIFRNKDGKMQQCSYFRDFDIGSKSKAHSEPCQTSKLNILVREAATGGVLWKQMFLKGKHLS